MNIFLKYHFLYAISAAITMSMLVDSNMHCLFAFCYLFLLFERKTREQKNENQEKVI